MLKTSYLAVAVITALFLTTLSTPGAYAGDTGKAIYHKVLPNQHIISGTARIAVTSIDERDVTVRLTAKLKTQWYVPAAFRTIDQEHKLPALFTTEAGFQEFIAAGGHFEDSDMVVDYLGTENVVTAVDTFRGCHKIKARYKTVAEGFNVRLEITVWFNPAIDSIGWARTETVVITSVPGFLRFPVKTELIAEQ